MKNKGAFQVLIRQCMSICRLSNFAMIVHPRRMSVEIKVVHTRD